MISSDIKKRIDETNRIRAKYPERVPIIVKKTAGSDLKNIDKSKYLAPVDMTLSQFIVIIRKRIKIESDKAIFVFIENILPPLTSTMAYLYEHMKNEDGFLYIYYNGESTFGNKNELIKLKIDNFFK
uniref:Autophagy protein n=1 Tax=Virus NIOZ-UU159 TaxID=2763270 RepID=A0A7S9XGD4_9VIRU|nr:MAG: autophagy protein [Virus NIOZ-UU159]|tara:strand:+ start:1037 stop:1417 length:381 start_codon:yes stop_codon:yes gene_type:complete